jgi:hypothetical protein
VASDAPIVFLVERLPGTLLGVTLGTPAPREPRSPYGGVIVLDRTDRDDTARTAAHELGHLLGLQHPENRGASGTIFRDVLSDTSPDEDNLMNPGPGTRISPGQAFALSRSPLLEQQ